MFGRTLHLHEKGYYQTPKGYQPHIHVQPYPGSFSGSVDYGAMHAFMHESTLEELEKSLAEKVRSRVESYQAAAAELGLIRRP